MSQTRVLSLVEAGANVAAGYGLAVGVQMLLLPVFGLHPTLSQATQIGVWFTVLSLARSYALRRLFERLGRPRT